jgi:hypothetical protein
MCLRVCWPGGGGWRIMADMILKGLGRAIFGRGGVGRMAAGYSPGSKLPGRYAAILLLGAMINGGCAASVYPPATVVDPVPIYLAQYHVHSTVLFKQGNRFVDYTFGDWNYAALHHKFINDAVGALTISGASTFERRYVPISPLTGEPVLPDGPAVVIRLYASRAAVDQRLAELADRFMHDLQIYRDGGVMTYGKDEQVFVKDDAHYGLINNCNDLTADTLRALGFRVDGPVISSQFHLCRPQAVVRDDGSNEAVDPP